MGPFASLSAAFLGALPAEQVGSDQVKEGTTKVLYPEEVCVRGKTGCTNLTGLGVRAKNLVVANVNVYSIGLYVDHEAAKAALSGYGGQPEKQLVANQAVYDDLMYRDDVGKALRLVINYGRLKRKQFVDALDERLAPSLRKAGHDEHLEEFRRQFDSITLSKGTELVFTTEKGGKLVTHVDGKQVGTIASKPLVDALFGIYVGPDAVSSAAKQSFGRGLAQVLGAAKQ